MNDFKRIIKLSLLLLLLLFVYWQNHPFIRKDIICRYFDVSKQHHWFNFLFFLCNRVKIKKKPQTKILSKIFQPCAQQLLLSDLNPFIRGPMKINTTYIHFKFS